MKSTLRAEISAFRFVGGVSHEDAGHIWISAPSVEIPPQSVRGQLLVFIELVDHPADEAEAAGRLFDLVRKTYQRTRGSVTTGLRTALQAANQHLLAENLQAAYEAQRDGAACCVVLRDSEAIIARAGPGAVYHIRGTRWTRYPAEGESDVGVPLGLRKTPTISFHQIPLAPGDQLLILDSRGAEAMAHVDMRAPVEAALSAALRAAGRATDFTAALIEVSGPPAGEVREGKQETRLEKPARRARVSAPAKEEEKAEAPRRPARRKEEASERRPLTRIAIIAAILIPILVGLAILGYNFYQDYRTRQAFEAAYNAAQVDYRTASTTTDEDIAKAALTKAKEELAQAMELLPEDIEAQRLQQELVLLEEKLYRVTPLYYMPELFRFVDQASRPVRVAVFDRDIYVLDAGLGVVTRHRLNELGDGLQPGEEAQEILRKGDQVSSVVVGNLIDLTVVPAGGALTEDTLCILDAGGNLFLYAGGALSVQPLPNRGELRAPLLMDHFTEARLYILDVDADQIYRYTPTDEGYTAPPEPYFAAEAGVDLAGVRDISIDGDVWLLFGDRVERYQAGQKVEFVLQGLDKPLSSPVGLFATFVGETGPNGAHLFIADAGNGRILELTKEGRFVRQLRPREGEHFRELHDIYVDQTTGRLIFLAGSSLYLADVPAAE